jgi:hypothetical protein
MSRGKKCVLWAVLMAACLSSVASAGAATAVVTGGPNVTGTSGTTLLNDHTVGITLSCTNSSWSGTLSASATGLLPLRIGTMTPGFTGCKIVGGLGITVACQPMRIAATALTAGGHTPLAFTGITCHEFITSQTACRRTVVGAMGARFQIGTPATFTVDANHVNLAEVNSTNGAGSACSWLPNDTSMRFTNTANGDPVYTVTPSNLALNERHPMT